MLIRILISLLLLLPLFLSSGINATDISAGNFKKVVGHSPSIFDRPFVGTLSIVDFDSETLQGTLEYILEINDTYPVEHPVEQNSGWKIEVKYPHDQLSISTDTVIYWPPPHQERDILTGFVKFTARMTGKVKMGFHLIGSRSEQTTLSLSWCVNKDRTIQPDGKSISNSLPCDVIPTFFPVGDSVTILSIESFHRRSSFHDSMVVIPTPRIGDTSEIKIYLTAMRDIESYELNMRARGFQIVSSPHEYSNGFTKGDQHLLVFKVIPNAVNMKHQFDIVIVDNNPSLKRGLKRRHSVRLALMFSDDGNMGFCSNVLAMEVYQYKPSAFREFDPRLDNIHKTMINSEADKE